MRNLIASFSKQTKRQKLISAILAAFLLTVFYLIFVRHVLFHDTYKTYESTAPTDVTSVELLDNKYVEGVFRAPSSRIRGVSLYVIAPSAKGSIAVTIRDGNGNVYYQTRVLASDYQQYEWIDLDFSKQLIQGRTYSIQFEGIDIDNSSAPFFITSSTPCSEVLTLIKDNASYAQPRYLFINYKFNLPFSAFESIILFAFIVLVTFALWIRLCNKDLEEKYFKSEQKLCELIQTNAFWIAVAVIMPITVILRYMMKDVQSGDLTGYLLPWYEEIKANGGFSGLYKQVGNYGLLYQFAIAAFTLIPIPPAAAFKIFSCIFDYLLALTCFFFVYRLSGERNKTIRIKKGVAAALIVLMTPTVMLNSAAWAQCDAIYSFFCVLALLFILKGNYRIGYVLYGISLAWKLQAVFLLPFILVYWIYQKRHSIMLFLYAVCSYFLCASVSYYFGRGIDSQIKVFSAQIHDQEYMTLSVSYPSVLRILQNSGNDSPSQEFILSAAILVTVVVIGSICVYLLNSKCLDTTGKAIHAAYLIAYACPLFLPNMHSRYSYMAEIIGTILLFFNYRTIPLWIVTQLITLLHYSRYLFGLSYSIRTAGYLNLAVWLCHLFLFVYESQISTKRLVD